MRNKIQQALFTGVICLLFSAKAFSIEFNEDTIELFFEGYQGCFTLYDLENDQQYVYNKAQCAKPLSPCSTYKIFNAMVGLQTNTVTQHTVFPWDGKPKAFKSWEENHTLSSAIKNSVVWFFQKMASNIGEAKMQHYIDAAQYGNRDISSGLTNFWLNPNSLKITAIEQQDILLKLYRDQLPFDKVVMDSVKEMLLLEQNGQYQFSGKTGSGLKEEHLVLGWFVGHVKSPAGEYIFTTNIQANDNAYGGKARKISKDILQALELSTSDRK